MAIASMTVTSFFILLPPFAPAARPSPWDPLALCPRLATGLPFSEESVGLISTTNVPVYPAHPIAGPCPPLPTTPLNQCDFNAPAKATGRYPPVRHRPGGYPCPFYWIVGDMVRHYAATPMPIDNTQENQWITKEIPLIFAGMAKAFAVLAKQAPREPLRLPALLELQGVQAAVDPPGGHQLRVGPRLPHLPLVHHDDPVGGQDRRQTMGDDEGGPAGEDLRQRLPDPALRHGVDARRRLVQQEDARLARQLSRERHHLALPRRQPHPALPDVRRHPLSPLPSEPVHADGRERRGNRGAARGDVLDHRPREEERFLEDQGEQPAELLPRKLPDLPPEQVDLPSSDLVEPEEQGEDRCLPRARRPHDRTGLSLLEDEGDPAQDRRPLQPLGEPVPLGFGVREPDVPEFDRGDGGASRRDACRRGTGGRGRVVPVLGGEVRVQDLEDPLGRGQRGLQDVVLVAHVLDGVVELLGILEERNE